MNNQKKPEQLDRLLPFAIKANIIMTGRENIKRKKSDLQFLWLTEDVTEKSKTEIINEFKHYPIVQCFTSVFMEKCLSLRGTKLVAFKKSDLARNIYRDLKPWRINGNTKTI